MAITQQEQEGDDHQEPRFVSADHFSANAFPPAMANDPMDPRWSHPGSMSSSCSSNWSPSSSRSSLPPGINPVAMPVVKPEHIDQDIPFSAFQLSLSLSQQPSATHPAHPAHHSSKHPVSPTKTKSSKRSKKQMSSKGDDDDDGTEDDPDVAVSDGEGMDLAEYNGVPKRKLSLKTRNRLKQRAHRERRALHLSTLESQVSELTELKAQKEFDDRLIAQLQFELSSNSALLAASESQRVAFDGMIREAERRDREQRTVIRLLEGEINRLRSIMTTAPQNTQGPMHTPPDSQPAKTSTAESKLDQTASWPPSNVPLDPASTASISDPTPTASSGWSSKDSQTTQPSHPVAIVPDEGFPPKDSYTALRTGQEPAHPNQLFPTQHPFDPQGNLQHPTHSIYNSAHYYYPYNPYQSQSPFYSQTGSYPNVFTTGRPLVPVHLFPPHLRPQSDESVGAQKTPNVASAPMAKRNSEGWLPCSPARTSISRASVMSDPTGRSSPEISSSTSRDVPVVPLPPLSAETTESKPTVQVTSPTLSETQSNPRARLASLPHLQTSFLGAVPPSSSNNENIPDQAQMEHPSLRSQTTGATSLHIPGPSPISAYGLSVPGGLWGGPPTGFPPFTPSGGTSSMFPISAGPGGSLGQGLASGTGTGSWPWSLSGLGLSPKVADREGEWEYGLMEDKTPMGGLTSTMEHRIKGSPEESLPPRRNSTESS